MDESERARLIEAWWSRWWAEDYSWAGLKRKRWRGWSVGPDGQPVRSELAPDAPGATLQDFWRAEEGRLISDPDDPTRWFTIAHAPLHWRNGAPEKATWSTSRFDQIDRAIDEAYARLPPGAFEPPSPSARPLPKKPNASTHLNRLVSIWPMPLQGVVVRGFPPIAFEFGLLMARRSAILEPLELGWAGRTLELSDALLCDGAEIAAIDTELRLRRALVMETLEVTSPQLRRIAAPNATFLGTLDLTGVTVIERCHLDKAAFHGRVALARTQLKSLSMSSTVLAAPLDLDGATVGKLTADLVTFKEEVSAKEAQLHKVDFDRTTFADEVNFEGAFLDGSLAQTVWERPVCFKEVRGYSISFAGSVFKSEVSFEAATYKTRALFSSVQFEQAARFDDMIWPPSAAGIAQAFREARFKGFASFERIDFWEYALFDGAKFDAEARLSRQSFEADRGLGRAMAEAKTPRELEQLEHGVRTLKLAAESVRDRELEQRLYAYQLQVRAESPMNGLQRAALKAYGKVSNYGASLGLPIAYVAGVWAICALIFLLTGVAIHDETTAGISLRPGPVHPATWEAMEMSARGIFSLLGTWSVRAPSDMTKLPDLESALLWRHAGVGLWVRVIWSLEAVIAGVLLFLAALSVRRWFQIN